LYLFPKYLNLLIKLNTKNITYKLQMFKRKILNLKKSQKTGILKKTNMLLYLRTSIRGIQGINAMSALQSKIRMMEDVL